MSKPMLAHGECELKKSWEVIGEGYSSYHTLPGLYVAMAYGTNKKHLTALMEPPVISNPVSRGEAVMSCWFGFN